MDFHWYIFWITKIHPSILSHINQFQCLFRRSKLFSYFALSLASADNESQIWIVAAAAKKDCVYEYLSWNSIWIMIESLLSGCVAFSLEDELLIYLLRRFFFDFHLEMFSHFMLNMQQFLHHTISIEKNEQIEIVKESRCKSATSSPHKIEFNWIPRPSFFCGVYQYYE